MATISDTYMRSLEALIGGAYQKLMLTQGADRNAVGSASDDTSTAKNMIRGGRDHEFGVKGAGDFTVSAYGTPTNAVMVSPGIIYAGGVAATIAATGAVALGGVADVNSANLGASTCYPALITIVPAADAAGTPTFGFVKGALTSNASSVVYPSTPRNEIPLAQVIAVGASGVIAATGINRVAKQVYFDSPGDDDYVTYMFAGFNTVEDAAQGKDRSSEFTAAVNALVSEVTSTQSKSFKAYWKDRGFEFSSGFKDVYYKSRGEDVGVRLFAGTPSKSGSTPSTTESLLHAVGQLEVRMESPVATNAATTQVDIWAITAANTRITRANANNVATQLFVENGNALPSSGWFAIKNYNNSWNIATYTNRTATTIDVASGSGITAHKAWDAVYACDKVSVYVGSGAASGASTDVASSGAKYLGVAVATVPAAAGAAVRVAVWNK